MLNSLAVIFILGLIIASIFNRIKLPSLVGMIIVGALIGPYGFDFLDRKIIFISDDLRELALVIILTRAGLSLNISDLKKIGRPALLMSFVPAILEILAIMVLSMLTLDFTFVEAGILGCVISAVSPAVIVPRMIKIIDEEYGKDRKVPQLILAGASVDDVFVIVLFSAFISLALGGEVTAISFFAIPISIVLGILLGVIVGLGLNKVFENYNIDNIRKVIIFLSISFALLFIEDCMSDIIPISGLLAIMFSSITINHKNKEEALSLKNSYNNMWIPAEIILFVLVGANLDMSYVIDGGFTIVFIITIALIFRIIGVFISLIGTQFNKKEKIFIMMSYTPKATVQAGIGAVPLSLGLECGSIVLTSAVIAILITAPIGAIFIDNFYKRLLTK